MANRTYDSGKIKPTGTNMSLTGKISYYSWRRQRMSRDYMSSVRHLIGEIGLLEAVFTAGGTRTAAWFILDGIATTGAELKSDRAAGWSLFISIISYSLIRTTMIRLRMKDAGLRIGLYRQPILSLISKELLRWGVISCICTDAIERGGRTLRPTVLFNRCQAYETACW